MHRIKFSAVFVLMIFVSLSNAQFRFNKENRLKQLKERLTLTDQQVIKVDSILTNTEKQINNIDDTSGDRRELMRNIMTDTNSQIEKILTPVQLKEYKEMQSERRNLMRERRPGRGM